MERPRGRPASGAWGTGRPSPCAPAPSSRPRSPGRSLVICTGRSAGESSSSVSGTRPPASSGARAGRTGPARARWRWARRASSRCAPGVRSASSGSAGPARPARPTGPRSSWAPRSIATSRPRTSAMPVAVVRNGASHSSSVASSARSDQSGHASPCPARRRTKPTRSRRPAAVGVQSSTPRRVARTRSTSAATVASPAGGPRRSSVSSIPPRRTSVRSTRSSRALSHTTRHSPLDLVGERLDQLVGVERRAEADARVVPLAVEVGGDDEAVVGQRVVGRGPRSGAGAQLEPAGLAAAHGDAVRVGQRQERAGSARRARRRGRSAPRCAGRGRAARSRTRATSRRSARSCGLPGDHGDAHREVGRQLVGAAAQHVALVDERGDHAGQRPLVGAGTVDHPGQARVHRQGQHPPAAVGDPQLASSAPSDASRSRAWRSVRGGGASMNRSCSTGVPHAASSSASPARSTWVISASRWARRVRVLELAPQPVGDARLGTPGPPGALVGRRPARRHRGQPAHPGALVEARHPGQAGVDDDAHAGHRERRLGDVGGQHHPPAAGRRRGQRGVLLGQRQRAGERVDVDRRPRWLRRAVGRPGGSHRSPAGTRARRRSRRAAPGRSSRPSPVRSARACPAAPSGRRRGAAGRRSWRRTDRRARW